MVRLSFKDENNQLIQYVKTTPQQTMTKGDLLVAYNDVLMPTGDRATPRTVAKLLADGSQATETKTIVIGLTSYNVKLLPVEII